MESNKIQKIIAANLSTAIEKSGITIEYLCEQADLDVDTLKGIMDGRIEASPIQIHDLAEALQLDKIELYKP